MKPRDVLDKLIQTAITKGYMIGSPQKRVVEACLREGKPIPENCLPGRLLETLTSEEREILKGLTSDDTKNERVWK